MFIPVMDPELVRGLYLYLMVTPSK